MKATADTILLSVSKTEKSCPIGEAIGRRNMGEGKIPVLTCEGGCIRGEIARLVANSIVKEEPFRRGCHGELLTVPGSAIARWIKESEKVVLIDGCFLHCHGRVLENMIGKDKLLQFDALSYYNKYTDRFDIDSVPEEERKDTAKEVAAAVLMELRKTSKTSTISAAAEGGGAEPAALKGTVCGCGS